MSKNEFLAKSWHELNKSIEELKTENSELKIKIDELSIENKKLKGIVETYANTFVNSIIIEK